MSTTISRRSIVRGVAALPAAAVLLAIATVEPDPIFAAIDAHRAAWAALERDCSRLDEEGTPEAEAKLDILHDAVTDAEDRLAEVEPTTMAGTIALSRYVAEHEAKGDGWTGARGIHCNVANAAARDTRRL